MPPAAMAQFAQVQEEVMTILIVGVPLDATARELENLCRFMPGYCYCKIDARPRGFATFVRFDCVEAAHEASARLNGQIFDKAAGGEPMRVDMARSNMHAPQSLGGVKRAEHPAQVDTVAVVGAADAGLSDQALEVFFAQIPGFVAWKANPRLGGGFAKFSSAYVATQAAGLAKAEGIPAEIAKSSMTNIGGQTISAWPSVQPPTVVPRVGQPQGVTGAPGSEDWSAVKRQRVEADPNGVDTIAIVGAKDQGFGDARIEAIFSEMPGFIIFKPQAKMAGGFVKFQSAHHAWEATNLAKGMGLPAATARNSMTNY